MKSTCTLRLCGNGYPNMLVDELSFSWKVTGENGKQKSYRIVVTNESGIEVWNTGEIESDRSAGIIYEGDRFESNTRYSAVVEVTSTDGRSYISEPVKFTTGLLDIECEWKAVWLTSPFISFNIAPVFRKEITIGKEIRKARLYICGLGYYELYINGKQVGDRYMDPAWTDFDKRVNYVAYDVESNLSIGKNALGVCLGSGWYTSGQTPRMSFTMQLMIEYADGTSERIISENDRTWKALEESWMLENSLYIGEIVDGRKIIPNWCDADFDYSVGTWKACMVAEPPKGRLVPMRVEPIRCVKEIKPISIAEPKPGVYVVDFGQNLAGIVQIRMHSLGSGTEVKIRFAEILDEEGMLSTENLRKAQACDKYIARGDDEEVYCPRFTYHGFRYAEITGIPEKPEQSDLVAKVMRTSVAERSEFSSSNELINAIQRICHWTENNNLHSVPTDCPQRDERLGWLNDLTVRIEEAIYNFDMETFFKKFFVDIGDEQGPVTGAITDTVPFLGFGGQPADPVCTSYLLIPYLLWKHYGDAEFLKKAWPGIKAWTDYLEGTRINGIVGYSYYGDWAAPIGGNIRFSAGNGAISAITPGCLMSTGFFYLDCKLLSEIATTIGMTEESYHYDQLAKSAAEALNRSYLNRAEGYYANNSQAGNVFMLYLDIVPEEYRERVIKHLIEDIREHDTHTTTGNICSRYIYDVLADTGNIDVAYDLVTQTTYPSWGYMLSRGATTTWERWEYVDSGELVGMASHDHPMYSTISGWFYKYLAGFRPTVPGFEEFELRPFMPTKLEGAKACVDTVKGTAAINWEQNGRKATVSVEVPFNSICRYTLTKTAKTLCVDGNRVTPEKYDGYDSVKLSSGKHLIEYDFV